LAAKLTRHIGSPDSGVSDRIAVTIQQTKRFVRATAIALSVVLLPLVPGQVQAAATESYLATPVQASCPTPFRAIQLAGSFHTSPNKLNDKYLAGKSGGRLGIGGTESIIFRRKEKP